MMPKAMIDNVAGHRSKYDLLSASLPAGEAGVAYVGGSDPILTGHHELEVIRAHANLDGAVLVDIGCGIGRLAQHLLSENISQYVGIDIIPEIMQPAIDLTAGDARFCFSLIDDCKIPIADKEATIIVAFSVVTHLIDEEIYDYFREAHRSLGEKGVGIFSFLDFFNDVHQEMFFKHHSQHRHGQGDMLRFTTKEILSVFAKRSGFRSVCFIDGQEEIPLSGRPSALIEVAALPPTFQMGQSVCLLRP